MHFHEVNACTEELVIGFHFTKVPLWLKFPTTFLHRHSYTDCGDGQLRFTKIESTYTGRVELCLKNRWGTICRHLWNNMDAKVACRQLGFTTYLRASAFRHGLSDGPGVALITEVNCIGNESTITECNHNETSNNICRERIQDAGVNCSSEGFNIPTSKLVSNW